MRSPRRGQIYRRKSDEVGKPRRVLIVSPTENNGGTYVLAAPFYGEQIEKRSRMKQCVLFQDGECGLEKTCVLKADEVTLFKISELRLCEGPVGEVDDERMRKVNVALAHALGIPIEPMPTGPGRSHRGGSQAPPS